MRRAVLTALAGVALTLTADGLAAQESVAGRFTVTPVVGAIRFAESSALANKKADSNGDYNETLFTPTVGLTAEYAMTPQFGLGFYFEAARPQTRGDYFPSLQLTFGSEQNLYSISQRVTMLVYGVQGSAKFDVDRVQPYVSGGVGLVTINGDPQQNDGNASFTTGQFQVGGGIGFSVTESAAFRVDVRDFVFTGWDREDLNVVSSRFQNTLFPAANGNPPDEQSTVHNIRVGIGFSFTPRRAVASGEGTSQE
jgi:opacity protein-like surface antigen